MAARRIDDLVGTYLPLLGTVPDQYIADKAGVSRSVIVNYRKRLGIAAYDGHRTGVRTVVPVVVAQVKRGPGRPRKDAAPIVAARPAALPPVKVTRLAAAPFVPVPTVPEKLDGRTRAARIARSGGNVAAPPPAAAAQEEGFRGRRSAIDPFISLLGKVSDVEIAQRAGVTPENVRTYRMRRNIGAPGKSEPAPVAAPVAAPVRAVAPVKAPVVAVRAAPVKVAPAPIPAPVVVKSAPAAAPAAVSTTAARSAFVVAVETAQGPRSYALIAGDIAEAARLAVQGVAARHRDGAIKSIMKVADLL